MKNHEGTILENHEQFSSKIELSFFRHDNKESDGSKDDINIRLNEKGKVHAMEQGELENIDQAVAFGSHRERTQETAAYHMAGNLPEIVGTESLEELKEKLNQGLDKGEKIRVDPKLDFVLDAENSYVDQTLDAFDEGHLLQFLVEKSDALAKEAGDLHSSTYSRQAGNIASLVKKYIQIAPRFDELVQKDTAVPYKPYEPVMHRFFGTHQSIAESFLAKVIEKTKGAEDRDAFLKVVDGRGFRFSEGFKVDIVTLVGTDASKIRISYQNEGFAEEDIPPFEFNEEVSQEIINQIIEEGKE